MNNVIISGTCHGAIFHKLLIESNKFNEKYQCAFIPNYQTNNSIIEKAPKDKLLSKLDRCSVLIYHDVLSYDFNALLQQLPKNSIAIKIPYIASTIYWPSHSRSAFYLMKRGATAYIPFVCTILNHLIEVIKDKKDIVKSYMNMDLSQEIDFESNFNKQVRYIETAQSGTPFKLSEHILKNYKEKQLFHLINHPTIDIFEIMSSKILNILGINEYVSYGGDPFKEIQTPVHPSVIDYYGLTWCSRNTKYNLFEKVVNFEEYLDLYIDAYQLLLKKGSGST